MELQNSRPTSAPACSRFASFLVCPILTTPRTCSDGTTSGAGRGLSLAPGVQVPEVIQKALESSPPAPRRAASNRESYQRKRNWWLPYVVLEFDNNQVLVDAMGGDLSNPIWNYRAALYADPLIILGRSAYDKSYSDVSRTSNISVSAYLRTAAVVHSQEDMGNDLLMARAQITPALDGHVHTRS